MGHNVVAESAQNLFGLVNRTLNLLKTHHIGIQVANDVVQAFARDAVEAALRAIDPDALSPREALDALYRLKNTLKDAP